MNLETVYSIQKMLERTYAHFVDSLDRSAMVFLSELIEDNGRFEKTELGRWYDRSQLLSRIEAAWGYLEPIPELRGKKRHIPLVFLEAANEREDLKASRNIMSKSSDPYGFYREKYGGLKPAFRYLHTETNFNERLSGDWGKRNRRTQWPFHFSNYWWHGLYPEDPGRKIESFRCGGYRFPDFGSVLGVSRKTATDYIARLIVHDLGHARLPPTPSAAEALHNSLMIQAMGVGREEISLETPWEAFVHAECVCPYFFIEAGEYAGRVQPDELDRTRRYFFEQVKKIYLGRERDDERLKLWRIPALLSSPLARKKADAVFKELRITGCARYADHEDRAA